MPAPSEFTYMISRLYARTLEAPEGAYRDHLIAAGHALEGAVATWPEKAPKPPPAPKADAATEAARALARFKARQAIQNARWDAVVGMTNVERRAFENLPKVSRAPNFTVDVSRKWLGKRDKLDGTRPCEFTARYSSCHGVVGGGPGCPSALHAAAEALQWFATTDEDRTAIREAPTVQAVSERLAPFGWEVLPHGSLNGVHSFIVRRKVAIE